MRYFALIACLCFATTAQAAQNAQNANSVYGGVFGGITLLPDITLSVPGASVDVETDAGFNLGAVIGYKWAMGLRAEGEISYRQNDVDTVAGFSASGDVSAFTFMGNAWYDFHTGTPWIPYAGGGLGVASVTVDDGSDDESDTVFAWQIGGGVGYEVNPGIILSLDYRYLATEDPEFSVAGGTIDAEYSSHNIMFGIRGHF